MDANSQEATTPSAQAQPGASDECLFYSEERAARLLGIHRTTLRALALAGRSPVDPVPVTEHRRMYRVVDINRLAGLPT